MASGGSCAPQGTPLRPIPVADSLIPDYQLPDDPPPPELPPPPEKPPPLSLLDDQLDELPLLPDDDTIQPPMLARPVVLRSVFAF